MPAKNPNRFFFASAGETEMDDKLVAENDLVSELFVLVRYTWAREVKQAASFQAVPSLS